MAQQEKMVEKWKTEHKDTVVYFEKAIRSMEVENRLLKDKVIKLKSQVSVMKEQPRRSSSKDVQDKE